jgi:voltage-gated potassium channel
MKMPTLESDLLSRLRVAGGLVATVIGAAVFGYVVLGHASILDAIYMAVITVAGVGYGEVVPTEHNHLLRIFNMFVVVIGVTITVYVFSVVTAFLVEGELRNLFWRRKMQKRINDLTDHFIVCGVGETGRHTVDELHRTQTPYMVIETAEENIKKLQQAAPGQYDEILYLIGDATDETVLEQAGMDRAKGVIFALATDKDNLVATIIARQRNANVRIITRCIEPRYAERMQKAGADSTVSPNRIGGMRMASEALRPHVVGFLDLMLREHSRTLRIEEIEIHSHSAWVGQTLQQLNLRGTYNLMVLATKGKSADGQDGIFCPNPPDDSVMMGGMIIIVMGDLHDLRKARHEAHHDHKHMAAVHGSSGPE